MNNNIAIKEWYLNLKHQIGENVANLFVFSIGYLYEIEKELQGGIDK